MVRACFCMTEMSVSEVAESVDVPFIQRNNLTSYGVVYSLIKISVVKIGKVVQFLVQTWIAHRPIFYSRDPGGALSRVLRHATHTSMTVSGRRPWRLIVAVSTAVETASTAFIRFRRQLQATLTAFPSSSAAVATSVDGESGQYNDVEACTFFGIRVRAASPVARADKGAVLLREKWTV